MKLIEKAKIGFMDAILKNDSIEALCEATYELLNWPMIVGRDTGDVLLMLPNEPIGLKRYDELQKSRKVPMEIFIGHQKKRRYFIYRGKRNQISVGDNDDCEFQK